MIQLGGNQANRQRHRRTVSSSSSSSSESEEEEDDQQEQQDEEDLEGGRSEGELSSEGSSLSDESLSSDEQESGSSISDANESEGPVRTLFPSILTDLGHFHRNYCAIQDCCQVYFLNY